MGSLYGNGVDLVSLWRAKSTSNTSGRRNSIKANMRRISFFQKAQLEFEVSQLKSQNKIFTAKASPKKLDRSIASIPQVTTEDLVQYDIYQWSPEKLLAVGEKELYFKNYKKSAQFYNEFLERFPKHELLNDKVLFGAGVAAFETKDYYPWAKNIFHL